MTGTRVLAAVVATVLATAVLPPAAAWSVNRARVNRARREVAALAERLRAHAPELRRLSLETEVLYGPGAIPAATTEATESWISARRTDWSVAIGDAPLSPDPWGHSYLVNVGRRGSSPLWVVSAGPNSTVEVPFSDPPAGATAGDDLAARIW